MQTLAELDFSTKSGRFALDSPTYLAVCEEGRFIVVGNEEHIYRFDLSAPMASWQEVMRGMGIHIAQPNDDGSIWIAYENRLTRVDAKGRQLFARSIDGAKALWGGTDWLVLYDEELDFWKLSSGSGPFERGGRLHPPGKVIAVWRKDAEHLQFLTVPEDRRLYLHEWNTLRGHAQQLNVLTVGWFNDLDMMDLAPDRLAAHTHVWPLLYGAKQIQLVPFGVHVEPDGRLRPAIERNNWQLIGDLQSWRQNAALIATIAATSDGIDPTRSFGSDTPFLVATLVDQESLHIITTLWHKAIALDEINDETQKAAMEGLKDYDLATLLLANWTGPLPASRTLAEGLARIVRDGATRRSLEPLFVRRREELRLLFDWHLPRILGTKEQEDDTDAVEPDIEGLRDLLRLAGHLPAAREALEDVLREAEDTQSEAALKRMSLVLAALKLSSTEQERLAPTLRQRLMRWIGTALQEEHDVTLFAENIQENQDLRLRLPGIAHLTRRCTTMLRASPSAEDGHASRLAVALLGYRARHRDNSREEEIDDLFDRVVAGLFADPARWADPIVQLLAAGGLKLPSSHVRCAASALASALLDADLSETMLFSILAARAVLCSPDPQAEDIATLLRIRSTALLSDAIPEVIAWLATLRTRGEMARAAADTPACLELILADAIGKSPAQYEPNTLLSALWDSCIERPPVARWGLAVAIWTTAQRLDLRLIGQGGKAARLSLTETPEARWLARTGATDRAHAEQIAQSLRWGLDQPGPVALVSRQLAHRAGSQFQTLFPDPVTDPTDEDAERLQALAQGLSYDNAGSGIGGTQ